MTSIPELPAAFAAADKYSLQSQRRVLRGTLVRLVLAGVATLCLSLAPLWRAKVSETREIEFLGIVAAALFLVAFFVELWLLRARPERGWYNGRAVAESVKTLAWRYAVGGAPYPATNDTSKDAFASDVSALGTDLLALRPTVVSGGVPTEWMEALRSADLLKRREAYMRERVCDQKEWYTRKAKYNRRRAKFWSFTLLASEALGVVLALLKSLSIVTIDLASLAAAVIASGVAWLAVKQHESVSSAYALASKELASIYERLSSVNDERQWAEEVASAEDAISREHTMWRASRINPEPTGFSS